MPMTGYLVLVWLFACLHRLMLEETVDWELAVGVATRLVPTLWGPVVVLVRPYSNSQNFQFGSRGRSYRARTGGSPIHLRIIMRSRWTAGADDGSMRSLRADMATRG